MLATLYLVCFFAAPSYTASSTTKSRVRKNCYSCIISGCQFASAQLTAIEDHYVDKHNLIFLCKECGTRRNSYYNLMSHSKNVHGISLVTGKLYFKQLTSATFVLNEPSIDTTYIEDGSDTDDAPEHPTVVDAQPSPSPTPITSNTHIQLPTIMQHTPTLPVTPGRILSNELLQWLTANIRSIPYDHLEDIIAITSHDIAVVSKALLATTQGFNATASELGYSSDTLAQLQSILQDNPSAPGPFPPLG